MAILPPLVASTVTAAYAAREATHKHFDSVGLSMSDLGSDCDRALWYSFRWASAPETFTGKKLRRFETGNIEEQRLIADLRRIPGVEVVDMDPETGRQFKVYALGGHLRGKLDGTATGLPEAPKARHVIECKATNDKAYKEVVKKKLKDGRPSHYRQCQMYMYVTGIDRCLYVCSNTNTDDIYSERIHYDAAYCMVLVARIERVINASRAPSRIAEAPEKWPCILCKHKDVCFSDKFGRNHCRTCISSTPCIDEGETWARWHCSRHGHDMDADEQRKGCGSHLYIPDVVPGEQQDAGDDFVAYIMRDGSEWRDTFHAPKDHTFDKTECVVCGCAWEIPTTDCPGIRIESDKIDQINLGTIDFVRGEWIEQYQAK